jgi:hypothetical protein
VATTRRPFSDRIPENPGIYLNYVSTNRPVFAARSAQQLLPGPHRAAVATARRRHLSGGALTMYNVAHRLITAVLTLALAWLAISTTLVITGHTTALHDIGATLTTVIDHLITQPIHDLTHPGT